MPRRSRVSPPIFGNVPSDLYWVICSKYGTISCAHSKEHGTSGPSDLPTSSYPGHIAEAKAFMVSMLQVSSVVSPMVVDNPLTVSCSIVAVDCVPIITFKSNTIEYFPSLAPPTRLLSVLCDNSNLQGCSTSPSQVILFLIFSLMKEYLLSKKFLSFKEKLIF